MILKTLTHDRGSSDCWNFYDNIETASVYYDEASKMSCIAVTVKHCTDEIVLCITDEAYLCNDAGQTIERLRPAVKQSKKSDRIPEHPDRC